jgi:hypothetical protein
MKNVLWHAKNSRVPDLAVMIGFETYIVSKYGIFNDKGALVRESKVAVFVVGASQMS